ncbi:MAG: hypothetical protein Q8N27_05260 [Candidatus Hydromicrobium sp.]|nr:hypothetical protein [Candidatus Hydromicrobium sp.]
MDKEKERAASSTPAAENSTRNGSKTINKVPQAMGEINSADTNLITDDTGISDSSAQLPADKGDSSEITVSVNPVNISGISSYFWEYNQWVCWKYEYGRSGKLTKVPYNAQTGRHASSNEPKTWTTWERVKKAYLKGGYDGIGFVLTASDPFVCVDLDNVRDPKTGAIEDEALAILGKLDTYNEISVSGRGVHAWVCATRPGGGKCKSASGKFEVYGHTHYIAMTGNKLPGSPEGVNSRQAELDEICAQQFSDSTPTVASDPKPQITSTTVDLLLLPDAQPPQLKLEELLRRKAFCKVWEHRRGDFPSLSEYDLSLADYAYKSGWTIQEYADLIIAFRHRWGGPDDVAKVLNPKYVQGRWAKASQSSDAVALLPFKVKRLVQLGTEDARYALELEDGATINMGEEATFLSPRSANQKLYTAGYPLTQIALKRWSEITMALRSLVVIIPTLTRREQFEQWMRDLMSSHPPYLIDPDQADSLSRAFSGYRGGPEQTAAVIDQRGRMYINLSNSASAMFLARIQLGLDTTQQSLAADLASLGFRRQSKVSITVGYKGNLIFCSSFYYCGFSCCCFCNCFRNSARCKTKNKYHD